MAIGEVAGSTVSSALSASQLGSTQRTAQQDLQASSRTGAKSEDTESVATSTATGTGNTGSTGDPSRGTRLDITV